MPSHICTYGWQVRGRQPFSSHLLGLPLALTRSRNSMNASDSKPLDEPKSPAEQYTYDLESSPPRP